MKPFIHLLLILSLTFLIQACQDKTKSPNLTSQEESKSTGTIFELPPVDIEKLTERLYKNYHPTPTTQAQIDENKLIDFAIKHKMDVTLDETGLYYMIIEQGKGAFIKHGDRASALYRGTFIDGSVFDSNMESQKLLRLNVGEMIYGWNVGLKKMRFGAKAIFLVPSGMAYGKRGIRGRVGKNTVLVFDVEILN